jgi:23S rRNA (adenine2503-C2)-methyltransferase
MTDLAKALRAELAASVPLVPPEVVEEREADDGTVKYRLRLADGAEIESVFMPEEKRRTLCVSTQVGCGMGCGFCATATMGLVRNLTAGEIAGQLEAVTRRRGPRPVSNVVFMGMGEPLANLDAVADAVGILLHEHGHGLSRRHLTVSTAGLVPAMEAFVHRVPVKLAVSLNATTDEQRSRIMPVNRRYGIEELLGCCRNLPLQHNDRVTFEYVMLGGFNDTLDDARRLVRLLGGIRCKVNLIPFNPFPGVDFHRPRAGQVERFLQALADAGISAFVRRSRGESLRGACGQLVTGKVDRHDP